MARVQRQNLICICMFFFPGGDRPATAVHMFNKTEDRLKVSFQRQSNYQMPGQKLHFIVWLY